MASTPATWAAKLVSTFSSTSTLFGFVVNPMWVSAIDDVVGRLEAWRRALTRRDRVR